LIECRAKDDGGPRLAERSRDVKTAGAGHLDVEQHEIGRQLGDPFSSLDAVPGIADDLDVGVRGQQLPQPLTRGLFVVHEQCSDRHR
jgi:hypothetical protein